MHYGQMASSGEILIHQWGNKEERGEKNSLDLHLYTARYRFCPLDMRIDNRRRIVYYVGCFRFPSNGDRIDGHLCTCQGGSHGTRIGGGGPASTELHGCCIRPHPRPHRHCPRRPRRRMRGKKWEMANGCNRG